MCALITCLVAGAVCSFLVEASAAGATARHRYGHKALSPKVEERYRQKALSTLFCRPATAAVPFATKPLAWNSRPIAVDAVPAGMEPAIPDYGLPAGKRPGPLYGKEDEILTALLSETLRSDLGDDEPAEGEDGTPIGRRWKKPSEEITKNFTMVTFKSENERYTFRLMSKIWKQYCEPQRETYSWLGESSFDWWNETAQAYDEEGEEKRGIPLVALLRTGEGYKGRGDFEPCGAAHYSDASINHENTFILRKLRGRAMDKCRSASTLLFCHLVRNSKDRDGRYSPMKAVLRDWKLDRTGDYPLGQYYAWRGYKFVQAIDPWQKQFYESFGCTDDGGAYMVCADSSPEKCKDYHDTAVPADGFFAEFEPNYDGIEKSWWYVGGSTLTPKSKDYGIPAWESRPWDTSDAALSYIDEIPSDETAGPPPGSDSKRHGRGAYPYGPPDWFDTDPHNYKGFNQDPNFDVDSIPDDDFNIEGQIDVASQASSSNIFRMPACASTVLVALIGVFTGCGLGLRFFRLRPGCDLPRTGMEDPLMTA